IPWRCGPHRETLAQRSTTAAPLFQEGSGRVVDLVGQLDDAVLVLLRAVRGQRQQVPVLCRSRSPRAGGPAGRGAGAGGGAVAGLRGPAAVTGAEGVPGRHPGRPGRRRGGPGHAGKGRLPDRGVMAFPTTFVRRPTGGVAAGAALTNLSP